MTLCDLLSHEGGTPNVTPGTRDVRLKKRKRRKRCSGGERLSTNKRRLSVHSSELSKGTFTPAKLCLRREKGYPYLSKTISANCNSSATSYPPSPAGQSCPRCTYLYTFRSTCKIHRHITTNSALDLAQLKHTPSCEQGSLSLSPCFLVPRSPQLECAVVRPHHRPEKRLVKHCQAGTWCVGNNDR